MTCYLTITDREHECEGGCVEPVGPGLIAVTNEMGSGELMPICATCLESLDSRLAAVLSSALPIEVVEAPEDD